jgi:hypothetical protein
MRADTTVFGVNFVDGRIKGYPKYNPRTSGANKMYFRMVRGNPDYGRNRFVENGDGTVSDSASMLMWQQADDGTARDWMGSMSYCEELELAGYEDWHLPNVKELQSIVDYTRSPMATNSPAIDPVFSLSEISDPEGGSGHYPFLWSTTTHEDGPNPYSAAAYVAFGEALGMMNGNLLDVHGAGAQRSDPKSGNAGDYPAYHGPQGDLQMVYNHCICVRDLVGLPVRTKEVEAKNFRLYPNPTRTHLFIELPKSWDTDAELRIYDVSQKLLIYRKISITLTQLDISSLQKGIYVLVCSSEEGPGFSQKIIKL